MKFNDLPMETKEEILTKINPHECIYYLRNNKTFEIMYRLGDSLNVKNFKIGRNELFDILEEHIKRMEGR